MNDKQIGRSLSQISAEAITLTPQAKLTHASRCVTKQHSEINQTEKGIGGRG